MEVIRGNKKRGLSLVRDVYNLICTADGFKTFDQILDRLLSVKRTIKQAALYPSDPPNIQKEMMNYFFDSQNIVKK